MQIDFSGLQALNAQVQQLANSEEIQNKALEEAGKHMQDRISAQAYATGLVRRSGLAASTVLVTDITDGSLKVGYSNQEGAFYMFFHEFGTSVNDATPVVRPTLEQERENIKNIMMEELRKGLGL